jgi:hypothetical protein
MADWYFNLTGERSQMQLMYGYENNKQLDLQSKGNIINFNAYQKDYYFQDFLINTDYI